MDKHRGAGQAAQDRGDRSGAFLAIDMSASAAATAAPPAARRTSRTASHGAARAESWMARVSTAMSHRIFSGGGRKLGGSRSTQIMPIQRPSASDRVGDGDGVNAAARDASGLAASSSQDSFLSSTSSVLVAPANQSTAVTAFVDLDAADELCASPSVACDVASSEEEDDAPGELGSVPKRRERVEWAAKVAPDRKAAAFDDDDDDDDADDDDPCPATGVFVPVMARGICTSSRRFRQHRDDNDEDEEDEEEEEVAPRVLKSFFSRSPSVGAELREQQRRARREAHYRRIRERQDQLRGRLDREDAAPLSDSARRRVTAQQLRRASVARRLEFRREAAAARELVLARVAEQDAEAFESARELWEREFQDEVHALTDAFRRARARRQRRGGESLEDGDRPATVAGLAVPEALAEMDRGRNGLDKRVRSAGDSPSPTRVRAAQPPRGESGEGSSNCVGDSLAALAASDEEEQEEVALLEAADEEQEMAVLEAAGDLDGVSIDVSALLGERERLLARVADIDRLVDVQRRLGLAPEL